MTPRRYSLDSAVRKDESLCAGGELSRTVQHGAKIENRCAYNQTRERFVGTEVEVAAVSNADARLPMLPGDFGAGLWLVPFKGLSPVSVRVPVDLIYLTKDCTVLDAVESFPISRGSAFGSVATSVLVLPPNTIRSTETQAGDQLFLCSADEMKRRLQPSAPSIIEREPEQRVVPFEQAPLLGSAGRLLQWEGRSGPKNQTETVPTNDSLPVKLPSELSSSSEMQETDAIEPTLGKTGAMDPAQQESKPAKTWLQRLFSPDPNRRDSPRESLRGLVAYFYTGGTPEAQRVRDISQSGVYVCTAERWYLGTVVRMTLTDRFEPTVERSITMNMAVVRCGEDGVGLKFLLQSSKDRRKNQLGVDTTDVNQFLHRFKHAAV
jgi:hypothetical protein